MRNGRRLLRVPVAVHIALALGLIFAAGALAQSGSEPCIPGVTCPTPKPPTPAPTATSPPTPTPAPVIAPPTEPPSKETPTPEVEETQIPEPSLLPAEEGELPPELQETFDVPVIARTRPRNTAKLVEALSPLTEFGLSEEQVLVEGMGRFPVAGLAYYSDDWLNPRFTPEFHLHQGLDIFADFGTPIRSPDKGVVSRLSNGGAGGIGVWIRGSDGTNYYFAHMQERVEGIRVGMKVKIGTVIGFAGDTGNADGGAPHLHFEVHPAGGAAVPPKPTVDRWLDAAERVAPRWVNLREKDLRARQKLLGTGRLDGADGSDLDATMLLTLLDPVGGAVGILPRLELTQAKRTPVSAHLMKELIHLRLHGFVLVPGAQTGRFGD